MFGCDSKLNREWRYYVSPNCDEHIAYVQLWYKEKYCELITLLIC